MTTLFFGIHTIEFMETHFYFAKKKKKLAWKRKQQKDHNSNFLLRGSVPFFPQLFGIPSSGIFAVFRGRLRFRLFV